MQAAIANVRDDTGNGTVANPGKRNNFKLAVSYLLPSDPVARRRNIVRGGGATEISSASANGGGNGGKGFGDKAGLGKTGVHLRWHTPEEFKRLSKKQKRELFDWRKTQDEQNSGGGKTGRASKQQKSQEDAIAAAVEEKLASMKKKEQDKKKTDERARSYIMSLFPETSDDVKLPPKPPTTTSNASAVQKVNKVTLQSILQKAKN